MIVLQNDDRVALGEKLNSFGDMAVTLANKDKPMRVLTGAFYVIIELVS